MPYVVFYSVVPTSKSVEGILNYFTCQEVEILVAFLPVILVNLLELELCSSKEGQQHPSCIGKRIARRSKGDPACPASPGEAHLGYWAQVCTPQCKTHMDIVG